MSISKEQFEMEYAERSKRTVESLRKWLIALPCDCGEDICEGWQYRTKRGYAQDLLEERAFKGKK